MKKTNQSIMDYYINTYLALHASNLVKDTLVLVNDKASLPEILKKYETLVVSMDGSELKKIKTASVSHVVAINVFNCLGEYEIAIQDIIRILKPKGTLIATLSSSAPSKDTDKGLWGFTENSTRYIFNKYFAENEVSYTGYGNVLTGRYFLNDMPADALDAKELDYYDQYFSLLIGVHAHKNLK